MYNPHQYRVIYIKEDKEKRFTTSANSLLEAMQHDYIKGEIVKVENLDYDRCCDKCFKSKPFGHLMGDGWCDRHGDEDVRFSFSIEKQPCPRCAEELKLCIWCGIKLEAGE